MAEDTAGLEAKVDMLLQHQAEQDRMLRELKSDFDQSRGALRLVKICAALAAAAATVWAAIHMGRP